ncbi:MAG TPA: VWA domain-containing protein [Candidatus Acidoferrales bacterium]|nr:VWA domain-containing protein [Candidatus Acidoferrales bacterium]
MLVLFLSIAASFAQSAHAQVVPPPPPPGAPATELFNSLQQKQQPPPGATIKRDVDLVVLHTTVEDAKGQFVSDLKQDNFKVYEDKVEQRISVFEREDIPVTMGLVIDNSGSMREKRAQVNAAALTFVKTSNPSDEVFVVNFNDDYYLDLDRDFTNDPKELQEALERIDSRGSTALYDAVVGSLDHLKKAHKDKRVLLVITDGDDDASRKTFEYTVKAAQQSNALIYAVGVFSDYDQSHDKRMVRHSKKILSELAESTGGAAYFPNSLDEVQPICTMIAHDIRNQYTLGYYPTNESKNGAFRSVQVLVNAKGRGKLSVRTRTGYYAKGLSGAQ